MRLLLALGMALFLFTGSTAHALQKNPLDGYEQTGFRELRGSWKVTQAPPFCCTRLAFEEDKIIIFTTDSVKTERRFKLDPKAKPAHLDVIEGESKAAGIYEVSGNTLKICLANWNADRPSEFKTTKGVVCLTLTREGVKSEDKKAEQPLPADIVKAWRDAGAKIGWMKDVPPKAAGGYGYWQPFREKGEAGAAPAFKLHAQGKGVLAKLPDPGVVFGLDLHCWSGQDADLKELAGLKNLQSLNIGGALLLKGPGLKELAGLKNLRALYVFYSSVTDAGLKELTDLKGLQVLDLSSTRVTGDGLKELTGLKSLQYLNLRHTEVTAAGVAALQKELPACKIEATAGKKGELAPEDDDATAYAAIRKHGAFADRDDKRSGRPIIAVDFNGFSTGVDFDDKNLREMAPLLAKLKHLEQLDLGGTGLSDAGMKDVAKFKQLRMLWLAGTHVTDDGLKELASLDQLNYLFLANDKITGVGLRHLTGLKSLKSLTLRGLLLTDAGVKELAALKQLQRLDLYESSLNDAGMKELARLEQLAWLNLSGTKVTDAGLKELFGHKNLRTLRLYRTLATAAAINDLQKSVPHCRIEITAETIGDPEFTPEVAKQSQVEMMRSKPGKALGFFNDKLVDEMAKMDVEMKKGEFHWTGAYRWNPDPGKRTTFVLFVGMLDDLPPLRPHPKGYLIHLRVYQGTFELRDGRWIATVPKWKYNLLD
jgi:uncharacterized protein (TIGR03067 family)